jgi:hypothetical protein
VTRDQRKQVAAQVAETRARQGRTAAISDAAVLARLAGLVADTMASAGVDQEEAGGGGTGPARRRRVNRADPGGDQADSPAGAG